MRVLILDGHPDERRLITGLLDHYVASLTTGIDVERIAVRDLRFNGTLAKGYSADQDWEPDLQAVAEAIDACDHLVVGFPLWWGGEPSGLKGLLDRLLLPGFAFRYHRDNPFWDRLLAGRSADVVITMDTPPWYLRLVYGNPVVRRWRHQVLGFTGIAPIRFFICGPVRRGQAAKRIGGWQRKLADAARTALGLKRGAKQSVLAGQAAFAEAVAERRSRRCVAAVGYRAWR